MSADPGLASIVFPADAGVIDITKEPYLADNTGKKDATAAIQKAIDDHSPSGNYIIYFPNGRYLVSDRMFWGQGPYNNGPSLQGQSRDGVVIALRDSCPGYADPEKRRGVFWTGDGSADNFFSSIRNMTVSTGRGNRGASGIQFNSSNQGTVMDVIIRTEDGHGAVGLDMGYTDMIGPCLIKRVEIIGFDIGILNAFHVNSAVFEHIRLRGQRVAGWRNLGQCITIRGLHSENAVTVFENGNPESFTTLIDAQLKGTGAAKGVPAIINGQGTIFVRGIKTQGYARALSDRTAKQEQAGSASVDEYVSVPVQTLFDSPRRTLRLPVRETPWLPLDPPEKWGNVRAFGANPEDEEDDTEAIQKAIDSGFTTIYFPPAKKGGGRYFIGKTVVVRGNVRRIITCGSRLSIRGEPSEKPAFVIGAGAQPQIVFERLYFETNRPVFSHEGPTTLILQHIGFFNGKGGSLYRSNGTAGDVFIDDVTQQWATGPDKPGDPNFVFRGKQRVWVRQINPETPEAPKIVNDGATVWILGLKTERGSPLIKTINNGRTELLGGLCYTVTDADDRPMFVIEDSDASLVIAEAGWHKRFTTLVTEKRKEEQRVLMSDSVPKRTKGSVIGLYCGVRGSQSAPLPGQGRGTGTK